MQRTFFTAGLCAATCAALLVDRSRAQAAPPGGFSTADLHGNYAVAASGTAIISGAAHPMTEIATLIADGRGHLDTRGTIKVGEDVHDFSLPGCSYRVEPGGLGEIDCVVRGAHHQASIVLVQGGRAFRFMEARTQPPSAGEVTILLGSAERQEAR